MSNESTKIENLIEKVEDAIVVKAAIQNGSSTEDFKASHAEQDTA